MVIKWRVSAEADSDMGPVACLGFLGPPLFGYENLDLSLLDFLGFSRPKQDLSMGYTA
jgi:hypothetical protein